MCGGGGGGACMFACVCAYVKERYKGAKTKGRDLMVGEKRFEKQTVGEKRIGVGQAK